MLIVFRVAAGILASFTAAAQIAALWYCYDQRLGDPLFGVLYAPWNFLEWFLLWGDQDGVLSVIAMMAVIGAIVLAWPPGAKRSELESMPEWGTEDDLRRIGLIGRAYPGELGGVILGETGNGRLITFDKPGHVLISGPTGAIKTGAHVIPSILSWRGSLLVSDPKATLFGITGAHRQAVGCAGFFDPTHPDSMSINPLSEIPIGGEREVAEVENICGFLIRGGSMAPPYAPADYYKKLADKLLCGMVLHVILDLDCKKLWFGELRRWTSDFDRHLASMLNSEHDKVLEPAHDFAKLGSDRKAGILTTIETALKVWNDPQVDRVTRRSDISISDLMCDERPYALYLQSRYSDSARLHVLMDLIVTQIMRALLHDTRRFADGREKRHDLLIIMEEFAAAGAEAAAGQNRLVADSLLVMREYRAQALMVTQSIAALRETYKTAVDGRCAIKIGSASTEQDEQKHFCSDAGQRLESLDRISRKRHGWFTKFDETVSTSQHKTPLMTYQQFRGLPHDRAVMVVEGCTPAFLIHKRPWWDSSLFSSMARNTRIGNDASTQSAKILAANSGKAHVEPVDIAEEAKMAPATSKAETPLAALARAKGWHAEKIQREFFAGEVSLRTVKQWISGSKPNIPAERLRKIREELSRG